MALLGRAPTRWPRGLRAFGYNGLAMIPLYDNIPSRTFPLVTYALIAANAAVFMLELSLGPQGLSQFVQHYAVIPARDGPRLLGHADPAGLMPLFTSMFLHGGWMHVIGNMLYLFIFGNNIEDRLGHTRFLIFYLLCGVGAGLAHVLTNTGSPVPTVGASGAIAGVLGAYLIFYPGAYIATLVIFGIFARVVAIPASLYLVVWFFMQTANGVAALNTRLAQGGVAWWAHVGGFVLGMALALLLVRRPPPAREEFEVP